MFVDKKRKSRGKKNELYKEGATELVFLINDMLGQHRTIPALRLKHRSGGCGTVSALPKCSIMSGCGTRIVLRGQKPLALCDRCPCFGSLFPPLAALTFAASSIIEHFGNADAVPQPPKRCLSRKAGIVRCCLYSNDKNSESIEPFKTCSMEALLNAKLPCAAPSSSV